MAISKIGVMSQEISNFCILAFEPSNGRFLFYFLDAFQTRSWAAVPRRSSGAGCCCACAPQSSSWTPQPQHSPEPPGLAGQDDPWWIASAGNTAPRKHPSSHHCQGTMAITPLRTRVWVARPSQPHTMPRSPPRCRGGGGTLLMVLRAPCCTRGSFYGKASPRW